MAITIIGGQVDVAFNGVTYSGFQMDESSETITGDIEEIRDDNNDMVTKLVSNKGHRYRLTGVVKATGTELTTLQGLVKGDVLTVNGANCMIEEIEINFSRLATRATITVLSDGITYT